MKRLRQGQVALLCGAALVTGAVQAASTTDYSGQWWVPAESGWGAAILQQANTMFVDLMVYGPDGNPTWFTVAASSQPDAPQGHTVFAGDLYATTGPYYGGMFDPSSVTSRKVGTLSFDASAADAATMSYSVDGTAVVKDVTRQTWTYENMSGTYDTVWNAGCGSQPGLDWTTTRTAIDHQADNSVTMTVTCPLCWGNFHYEFRGSYSQSGRLGRITADQVAPPGGVIVISEIAHSAAGFTGRLAGTITNGGNACSIDDGLIGAALR